MALQKQLVPLQIDKGLDTKIDSKQEEPGYLRVAQNIIYETIKKLRKRNGYDSLPLQTLDADSVSGARKLAKYKTELLLLSSDSLYSYSTNREKFTRKGALYGVETKSTSIAKNADDLSHCDSIVVDNFQVFVWQDNQGNVRYSVQDTTDLSFIVANGLIAAGEMPVVSKIQNDVYVVYGSSADISFKSFSILEPQTLSTATVVASNRNTSTGLIACQLAGTNVVVAYNANAGGNNLKIFKIQSDGGTSSIVGVTGQTASNALHVYVDTNSRIIVTYSNGSAVKVVIYPLNLNASLLAPTSVEAAAVSTCCAIETASAVYDIYYEVVVSGVLKNYVKKAQITLAGTVSGAAVFCRSVGLAANVFAYADNQYVPVVIKSTEQSSYFLLDSSSNLVTKWANQTATSVLLKGVLPHVFGLSDSQFLIASTFRNRLRGENGTFYSTGGVGKVSINFAPDEAYSNAELADGLHICAGVLKLYDGASVTEHGFHVYPEYVTKDSTATTGGHISDGNYGYVAIYKWTDNTGKDHRSAPTQAALEAVLTGGTDTQTVTLKVPTLRLTEKTNVVIEIYRTENAGTQYYKVTSDASPLLNDKTTDEVSFTDTIADATLINRELLYTTGGVLENIAAPAASKIEPYNGDRLAVVGEDGTRVFFSKETTEGGPVEFTDLIYRDVAPAGGPITSIRSMAEKLIIQQMDATHYVAGEGPLNTGQQDTLTKPEIVATDIGCLRMDASILTPGGLMFKSRKGIYMLNGGMALQYVGDKVEAFNGATTTSAQIVGELNQVRFLLFEQRALVYNYNLGRWATFENHGGLSSITINNDYYYLRPDGTLYKENRNSYADNSSPIKFKIETGWLTMAELQGFQRAYHALILGQFKSPHKLRIKVAYDFIDAWVSEEIINTADFVDAPIYGADSPYGSGSPYGGDGALYQLRLDFEQQKCTSLRLSIEDVQAEAGEGFNLSGITVRAGLKEGSNKLGAANKFGAS